MQPNRIRKHEPPGWSGIVHSMQLHSIARSNANATMYILHVLLLALRIRLHQKLLQHTNFVYLRLWLGSESWAVGPGVD